MHIVTLWIGWALVWTFGVAVVSAPRAVTRQTPEPATRAWTVGCGWFVGQFLLTLWMRCLSAIGEPFGVAAIGAPLLVVTVVAGSVAWRRSARMSQPFHAAWTGLTGRALSPAHRALWLALLGWLVLRMMLLLTEVVRRPLYPWDAWTQWGTKARVWYELRTMAPFVPASEWLSAASPNVYFDSAPHYPATVPLTQVWSATLLGEWNDALVNLPWWLTGVAFGLALYGFVREHTSRPLLALVVAWMVLSLPILDAHIALAGYADLAMSAYFTLAALAAIRWTRTRRWDDAAVALLMVLACALIKNPGRIWIVMLAPGIAAALLPRHGLRVAAIFFAVVAAAALILTRIGVTLLGYRLQLQFDMPWSGLSNAYFVFANWNLLWYGALLVAVVGWKQLLSRDLAPLSLTVAAGVAFLMFGFAFTNARAWVEDQSTVNRATLHLAPLIVVWMVLAYRAWVLDAAQAAGVAPASA